MKFIDTNLLVRLITNDDQIQCAQAMVLIENCAADEIQITAAVLVELFFVLESRHQPYKLSRQAVSAGVAGLLELPQLTVKPTVAAALQLAAKNPKLDFTDCLLAIKAAYTADRLFTFDKDLLKILA